VPDSGAPILLYDGTCGFCNSAVQLVLRWERAGSSLRFARLEGEWGERVRGAHPELVGVDTVIWYQPPAPGRQAQARIKSDAAIDLLGYLGGLWLVPRVLLALVPRALRDAGYDFIARRRSRIRPGFCALPTAGQRARFLDR